MEKYSVTVAGREIPLRYTMRELMLMEEDIGTMDKFSDLILKGKNRIRNMAKAICVMGNGALSHEGKEADLTFDWLIDHIDPTKLKTCQIAVLGAFTDGFQTEHQQKGRRDLGLEELEREKKTGN